MNRFLHEIHLGLLLAQSKQNRGISLSSNSCILWVDGKRFFRSAEILYEIILFTLTNSSFSQTLQYAMLLHSRHAVCDVPNESQTGHFDACFTAVEIDSDSFTFTSPITTVSLISAILAAGEPIGWEQNGHVTQSSSTPFPHSRQNGMGYESGWLYFI